MEFPEKETAQMARTKYIKIQKEDNVLVALEPLPERERLRTTEGEIIVITPIPIYHKVAARDIARDQPVIKYGAPIGFASGDIQKGEHVHVHNVDASALMKG